MDRRTGYSCTTRKGSNGSDARQSREGAAKWPGNLSSAGPSSGVFSRRRELSLTDDIGQKGEGVLLGQDIIFAR